MISPRTTMLSILDTALRSQDPRRAVSQALNDLGVDTGAPMAVIAIGKAATAMARGALDVVPRARGLIITHVMPDVAVPGFETMTGDHPTPGAASLAAGHRALDFAAGLSPDFVLFLISGGGSALAEVPRIDLSDVATTVDALDRAGASIQEINTVRSRCSLIKGGGLARALGGLRFGTLVISDVPGDDPAVVASGPTLAPPADLDAADIIARYGLVIPEAMASLLTAQQEPVPEGEFVEVISSGAMAAAVACATAAAAGFGATPAASPMTGEAADAARAMLDNAGRGITVWHGETTVTRRGDGRGGRNQEAALAAAVALDGADGIVFLAAATDGRDGPTDNSGGIVDGATAATMRHAGIDPVAALATNDSATALEAAGAHLRSGPTGTNVGDLWMVLRE